MELEAKMTESMTLEEVGEWLKERGLSGDIVEVFAGEFPN